MSVTLHFSGLDRRARLATYLRELRTPRRLAMIAVVAAFPPLLDRIVEHLGAWQREDAYRRRFALVMGQKNQLWSYFDVPLSTSNGFTASGPLVRSSGAFCTTNATWNNAERLRLRSGANASTSFSNGTS